MRRPAPPAPLVSRTSPRSRRKRRARQGPWTSTRSFPRTVLAGKNESSGDWVPAAPERAVNLVSKRDPRGSSEPPDGRSECPGVPGVAAEVAGGALRPGQRQEAVLLVQAPRLAHPLQGLEVAAPEAPGAGGLQAAIQHRLAEAEAARLGQEVHLPELAGAL